MTTFKLDDTMQNCYINRNDFIAAMKISGRMYAWFDGEDIAATCDSFAIANPQARLSDFVNWTKRTILERMNAARNPGIVVRYKLTMEEYERPPFGQRSAGVTTITDAVAAKPKVPTSAKDLPIIHTPGNEPEDDHDNPLTPEEVKQLQSNVEAPIESKPKPKGAIKLDDLINNPDKN